MPLKLPYLLVLISPLLISCSSTQEKNVIPEEYANVVELAPAPDTNTVVSKIYVDSAKVIEREGSTSLLIMGNFPDGCTNIGKAEHQVHDDNTISLMLNGWRNPDQMCTQALVAFSFIYREIPGATLSEADKIQINGTDYPLNQ